MIVQQDIQRVATKLIDKATPQVLQGMMITRTGTLYTSATGTPGFVGLAIADLAAYTTAVPSVFCACPQDNRLMALITGGRVAVRVRNAVEFAALVVGGTFQALNGEASTTGTIPALTINGDALVIDEKVVDSTGSYYFMVYMN